MKKNIFIPIIIITILLLLYFLFQNNGLISSASSNTKLSESELERVVVVLGNKEKEIRMNFRRVENPVKQRNFLNYTAELDFKLGGIEEELFLYPARVKVDNKNNIYVLDVVDCTVKIFDEYGNLLSKIGSKGQGPGEFSSAFNFDIIDDKLVISNPNDNKFSIFDISNNSLVNEIKTTLFPTRLSFLSDSEIVIFQMLDPIGTSPFIKYDILSEEKNQFKNFIYTQNLDETYGMLPFIVGETHRYGNQLIYIASVLGYVLRYDNKGNIINTFKLIDKPVMLERRRQLKESVVTFPRKEEYLTISTNIYADYLYVLSNQSSNLPKDYVVDVYSIKEAKYKFSLRIKSDVDINSVYFTDKKFFLVKENTEVAVYNYKLSD